MTAGYWIHSDKPPDQQADDARPVSLENATGVTRDVSVGGVFFWISGTHTVGDRISFSIEIQRPEGNMMLRCRGVVVRTEPRGTDVGVAVRIFESEMEIAKT
jgi:hypothetical protein